jgi:hypothetical protein
VTGGVTMPNLSMTLLAPRIQCPVCKDRTRAQVDGAGNGRFVCEHGVVGEVYGFDAGGGTDG